MALLSDKLEKAYQTLRSNDIADPRREASSLLALALKRDKSFLIAHPEYVLTSAEEDAANEFVRRRALREPLQYISGVQEFYGLEFNVTPDVLIPRPETELIVERAIEILASEDEPSFCEVGIGSGCISISVLFHKPHATALGLDVSQAALQVARRNAAKHNVSERLRLAISDVFESLTHVQFDLIVSNPPYVPARGFAGLQTEVRDFEPEVALRGGLDGLSIITRIINGAPRFLKPEGYLLLEIGFDQSEKVAAMFDPAVWNLREFFPDLQGIPRMVAAQRI